MFGGSSGKSSGGMFGSGGDSSSESMLPFTFQDEPACAQMCPNLTYQQRIIGFVSCTALGTVMSLIGTLILLGGTNAQNVRLFAILYVFGNVIALAATGFLIGPRAQCRKMWLPTRRWSTAFYLLMIIIVFVVALLQQSVFLVLFLLFVEIVAGCWYSISYIPFARKIVGQFLRTLGIFAPCFWVHDNCNEQCKKWKKSSGGSSSSSGGVTAAVFGNDKGGSSSDKGGLFGGGGSEKNSSGFFGGGGGNSSSSSSAAKTNNSSAKTSDNTFSLSSIFGGGK